MGLIWSDTDVPPLRLPAQVLVGELSCGLLRWPPGGNRLSSGTRMRSGPCTRRDYARIAATQRSALAGGV